MALKIKIQTPNLARLKNGFQQADEETVGHIWDGMKLSVEKEAEDAKAKTPVRTGALRDSIATEVHLTAKGARGRVFTMMRYGPFEERGTIRNPARQMFERTVREDRPWLDALWENVIGRVTEKLKVS